jgi:hypothetical protein
MCFPLLAPPHPPISTPSLSLIWFPLHPRRPALHYCPCNARLRRLRSCHYTRHARPRCVCSRLYLRHAQPRLLRSHLIPCLVQPHRPHLHHTRPLHHARPCGFFLRHVWLHRPCLRHAWPRRPLPHHARFHRRARLALPTLPSSTITAGGTLPRFSLPRPHR